MGNCVEGFPKKSNKIIIMPLPHVKVNLTPPTPPENSENSIQETLFDILGNIPTSKHEIKCPGEETQNDASND